MSKRPSIKKQVIDHLQDISRFGESKHKLKLKIQEECKKRDIKYSNGMVPYIYSYNSFNAYKDSSMQFVDWLRCNNIKPRYIDDINKKQAVDYLKYKQSNNYSSYSISRDMAAINKIWGFGITKKDAGLNKNSIRNITRSRENKAMDLQYNREYYKDQILVAKAFGLRRESIHGGQYAIKNTSIFKKDSNIYCSVIEKGGKYREAPCLEQYKQNIINTFNPLERESFCTGYTYNSIKDFYRPNYNVEGFKSYYKSIGEALFDSYSSRIDNHSFRREYAQNRYAELIGDKGYEENTYRGYDREVVLQVSSDLGHNREDVVVNHYLK